jgi:small ligand-binding sensory domain FIST
MMISAPGPPLTEPRIAVSIMTGMPPVATPPAAAEACSRLADTRTAALEVAERLDAAGLGSGSVLLCFLSFHHTAAFPEAMEMLRRTLSPASLLATTAAAVVAGPEEFEAQPALAAIAIRIPGVEATPIRIALDDGPLERWSHEAIRSRFGFTPDGVPPRAIVLIADPFGMPAAGALGTLARLHPRGPAIPVFGGIASGSSQIGGNLLAVNDRLDRTGLVGLAFHGPIEFSPLLSTAGRAIGRPMVVTDAQGTTIRSLGGLPALEAAKEACERLDERERSCLQGGLLLGIASEETGEGPGRNDYLLRPIAAAHLARGELVLPEPVRPGRLVRFHLRDPQTATEDLELALDAAQLGPPPLAAITMISTARGRGFFGESSHDASRIFRRLGPLPMAGCFTGGEFAPGRLASHPHGHSVAAALLRPVASVTSPTASPAPPHSAG